MGEKSEQKKKLIVNRARAVFSEKGFKAVTMKDIVDACEISRGGLYLYFSNTAEIFQAVLDTEAEEELDEEDHLDEKTLKYRSASDLLALFIKEQKKQLFLHKNNLGIAEYEYFSQKVKEDESASPLKDQFDTAALVLERMVENGIRRGEFECEDPHGFSRNLMYAIEGMKIAGLTMRLSESDFDREILYALRQLRPAGE